MRLLPYPMPISLFQPPVLPPSGLWLCFSWSSCSSFSSAVFAVSCAVNEDRIIQFRRRKRNRDGSRFWRDTSESTGSKKHSTGAGYNWVILVTMRNDPWRVSLDRRRTAWPSMETPIRDGLRRMDHSLVSYFISFFCLGKAIWDRSNSGTQFLPLITKKTTRTSIFTPSQNVPLKSFKMCHFHQGDSQEKMEIWVLVGNNVLSNFCFGSQDHIEWMKTVKLNYPLCRK